MYSYPKNIAVTLWYIYGMPIWQCMMSGTCIRAPLSLARFQRRTWMAATEICWGPSCSLVAGEKQTLLLSRETIHVKFSSGWQLYVCNDVTPDINVKAILIKHFQINNHIDRARDRTRSNIGAIYSSQELALSQDLKMMRLKFYSNNWCTKKKDKFKLLWHDQLVSFILGPPCLAFESWIRSLNGKFKMVTSL